MVLVNVYGRLSTILHFNHTNDDNEEDVDTALSPAHQPLPQAADLTPSPSSSYRCQQMMVAQSHEAERIVGVDDVVQLGVYTSADCNHDLRTRR